MATNDKNINRLEQLMLSRAIARKLNLHNTQARGIGWDTESVKQAIFNQRRGEFSTIAQLADSMSADAAYMAPLSKRINSLLRSELSFEAYSEKNQTEEEASEYEIIKDTIKYLVELNVKQAHYEQFLRSYLEVGIGLMYVTWEEIEGTYHPKPEVLPIEFLRWDNNNNKFVYRTQNGEVDVTPNDGNWVMLSKWTPNRAVGFAATLGTTWLARQYTLSDWLLGNQIQNELITLISEEEYSTSIDEETRAEFIEQLQIEQSNRVMYIPPGYKIEQNPANPNYRPEAYNEINNSCIRQYQISILGGNLSTEVTNTGGNRAASQTHYSVEKEMSETDAHALAECLNEQLLPLVGLFNLGEKAIYAAPKMRWAIRPGESLSDTMAALQAFAALAQTNIPGYRIDNLEEIARRLGIDLTRV